jgi:Fe-S cluster assembly iron-binding protein IscA
MGCSGPQLGISLDQASPDDQVFEEGGFTFLIEKKLLEDAKPVKVDYIVTPQGEGFMITSSLMNNSSCGGCCSSCS